MSKILLLGDLHAAQGVHNLDRVQKEAKKAFPDLEYCIQVGDFGFYKQTFEGWDKSAAYSPCIELPLKTFAIGGNHEDYEWLNVQDHKLWETKFNLFYKKRGTIEEIDGVTIGFLGGALNVDRRQEGSIDKRTTNYPLHVEVEEALEKFNSVPKIDLMITHSCPHSIGIGMVGSPIFFESIEKFCHDKGHSTGPNEDCGEGALRRLWHGMSVKPDNWVYGHFHQTKMKLIGNTYFYCIGSTDCSDMKDYVNPFVYDTKTKQIEYFNDIRLLNFDGFHKTRLK
jgi:hypothetical protein